MTYLLISDDINIFSLEIGNFLHLEIQVETAF